MKLQTKFKNTQSCVLDEIGIVGCCHLDDINTSLKIGKCEDSAFYGNVDMLKTGDFWQFPPIKDTSLSQGWSEKVNMTNSAKETKKMSGINLWRQTNRICILDQQMRCEDQRYLDFLHRLREGKCTEEDLHMLNERVIGQNVDITSILDTPIIVPSNELSTAINNLFTTRHSLVRPVYVCQAKDYIGKIKDGKPISKSTAKFIKKMPATSTQGLPTELQFFIGMPVMVTRNLYTELGITNGTTGIIRSVHFNKPIDNDNNGLIYLVHQPTYIVVELKDISMKPLEGLPPNHVPIYPQTTGIQIKVPNKKRETFNRRQFPLVPRFSITAHKSQGQTLRKAIVDLEPPPGRRNAGIEYAYVPLSRVRRLEDLTLLRPVRASVLTGKVNENVQRMMDEFRMRDLCKDL